MRGVTVSAAVAFFLIVLCGQGFAAQRSPIPIFDCENITRPGNYLVANDLVLTATSQGFGEGGNCLVISSSHVNVDLGGWSITVACPPLSYCPPEYGVVGGIGIEILNRAAQVSISNGTVAGFVYGIVGEGSQISATNLELIDVVGISLDDVAYSSFTNISYKGADTEYHGSNGPIVYLNGGGGNVFANLNGQVGTDLGLGPDGIEIVNSNFNLISSVNLDNTSCGGTDVLLSSGSSYNAVMNINLFDECGGGIEVDKGSRHNLIRGNTVMIASPADVFAMFDQNPNCGSDVWTGNSFSNIFSASQSSASPLNCID
jgi:hypothetical protein